jgi:cyclase
MNLHCMRLSVIGLACLLSAGGAGSQDFSKAEVHSVKVTEGVYLVYVENGPTGGNIGVSAGADGVVLIDSLFGQLHEKVEAAVAQLGAGPVRFVLNTNAHYDHALGNELFAKDGAVIVAHENARTRMRTLQVHDLIGSTTQPFPAAAMPAVTFADSLVLHVNGEDIEAIHVAPAHSDNDVFYRFRQANVIHTGDLFFPEGFPYVDVKNGGAVNGMIAAADRILALSDEHTRIIPGHGRLSDRRRLQEYRSMLVTVKDRVAALVREGKTLEAVVAAKPTADMDRNWRIGVGMPADLFVTMVFEDLRGGR